MPRPSSYAVFCLKKKNFPAISCCICPHTSSFYRHSDARDLHSFPTRRSSDLLHEVITFLVSMQISISSLQTHNVNRCGRSRHLARKLSLRRKRSSPNVFEMAATETITSIILIKLIRVSLGTVRHPR